MEVELMKKYHLADVCTGIEFCCALIIIGMTWFHTHPRYILATFLTGQICDAIDGPLARRFRYPKDGKYRWWREYAGMLDQLSDILLGITTYVYIAIYINHSFGCYTLIVATAIALIVQTCAYNFPPIGLNWLQTRPRLGKSIVLIRRWLYVGLIVYTVWLLLRAAHCGPGTFIALTIALLCTGAILFVLKFNRLSEVKTL